MEKTVTDERWLKKDWPLDTSLDIVARIRKRFPRPRFAHDGLMANEAADEIERLRGVFEELEGPGDHMRPGGFIRLKGTGTRVPRAASK